MWDNSSIFCTIKKVRTGCTHNLNTRKDFKYHFLLYVYARCTILVPTCQYWIYFQCQCCSSALSIMPSVQQGGKTVHTGCVDKWQHIAEHNPGFCRIIHVYIDVWRNGWCWVNNLLTYNWHIIFSCESRVEELACGYIGRISLGGERGTIFWTLYMGVLYRPLSASTAIQSSIFVSPPAVRPWLFYWSCSAAKRSDTGFVEKVKVNKGLKNVIPVSLSSILMHYREIIFICVARWRFR